MTKIISLFAQALNQIDETYFGVDWFGEGFLNAVNANDDTKKTAFRHWERVFCYELYHKIRCLIDKQNQFYENQEYWKNVKITAELQKPFLKEMTLSTMNVEQLEKRFIPDFLIHDPHNSNNQDLVVEVKTKPELKFTDIKEDLEKINQFIKKYKYKEGLFIAANNTIDNIKNLILQNVKLLQIHTDTQEYIYIATKFNSTSQVMIIKYSEIIKTLNHENT